MLTLPSPQQLELIEKELQLERPLPQKTNAEQLQIAYSRVFRRPEEAMEFAKNIMLNGGQSLVAGQTSDSAGNLWWMGVHINDLDQWRSNGGYHHVALHDPEIPEDEML